MSLLKWSNFAYHAMQDLACIKSGENVLIFADTNTDMDLAQACLSMALTLTSNAQLIVVRKMGRAEKAVMTEVAHHAILHADVVVALCETRVMQSTALREALQTRCRVISTTPPGIEDYLIKGVAEVNFDKMLHNAKIVSELWRKTKVCRVTSAAGSDFTCEFTGRPVEIGDGAARKTGDIGFFPGIQINIAPIEETINGIAVVDGSISPGGLVSTPVKLRLEAGKIVGIDGGADATSWAAWLAAMQEPKVYEMCHFSVGMNPQAKMSGNMIQDERVVGALTIGFGNQADSFQGKVGHCNFHVDAVLACPQIYLDGVLMNDGSKLNKALGFVDML